MVAQSSKLGFCSAFFQHSVCFYISNLFFVFSWAHTGQLLGNNLIFSPTYAVVSVKKPCGSSAPDCSLELSFVHLQMVGKGSEVLHCRAPPYSSGFLINTVI